MTNLPNLPGEHAATGSPWYRRLWESDGFRRVLRTFLIAFLGLLVPGALGWLNDLTEWARSEGQAPLPDARSLAYVGVMAVGAGFIAVLNALWIGVEDATGKGVLRQVTPKPRPGERGVFDVRMAAGAALAIGVVVLLLILFDYRGR